jgi:hypothetical protein
VKELGMVRCALSLFVGVLLLSPAWGGELLLAPAAYGETTTFWEKHALVDATVEAVRLADDGRSLEVSEHLRLRVQESIPGRHAADGRLLPVTIKRSLGAVRDRPQGLKPHFRKGDRLLLLLPTTKKEIVLGGYVLPQDARGRVVEGQEVASYAMMPGGVELYPFTKERDPIVAETKRLCRAISTEDVPQRLKMIEAMLKEKPGKRVTAVLKRSLEATASRLEGDLQDAKRLLKLTGRE